MSPRGAFRSLDLPQRFVLEMQTRAGEWVDHGLFDRDAFAVLEDGSYLCAGHGGSPVFLRCVAQRGDEIDVLDGAGVQHTYRLVAFPSDRYQPRA